MTDNTRRLFLRREAQKHLLRDTNLAMALHKSLLAIRNDPGAAPGLPLEREIEARLEKVEAQIERHENLLSSGVVTGPIETSRRALSNAALLKIADKLRAEVIPFPGQNP